MILLHAIEPHTTYMFSNYVHFCKLSFEHGLVFVTTARATPMMVMPSRKLFQIGPLTFSGPLKGPFTSA
ncbi:hypothetical protein Hanom_Chr07g00631721 [Helianthus anomalus]